MLISLLHKIKPYWFNFKFHCYLCLNTVETESHPICTHCKMELSWISIACECCGLPISQQGFCGKCINHTHHYTKIIAPWSYEFPIAQLITRFKHNQQWALGKLLTELLIENLMVKYASGLTKPDYLLAIPLAKQRLRQRGFNQSQMIMSWLAKDLNITTHRNIIKRVIDTVPQQQLSAKQRLTNLKHAFKIVKPEFIQNKHIALVDDVVTTGATVGTLAKLLINGGAKRIDVYCLARTPYTIK